MQHSVQLYSVRDQLARDPEGTLRRLREIGFEAVEPFDLAGRGVDLAETLRDLGLAAPSAHAFLLETAEADQAFAAAQHLGTTTLIQPITPPEQWRDEAGIRAIADQLNAAAETARGHGLAIGYHNHGHEAEPIFDGRTGLHVLADHLSDDVVLEVDVFWAAVGGADVPALLTDLGDRVQLLHLKDGVTAPDGDQLPLGRGNVPLPAILEAATAARLGVVEFDEYAGDLFDGIAASYSWLQENNA